MKGKVIKVNDFEIEIEITGETTSCESCSLKHSCSLPEKKNIKLPSKLYSKLNKNDLVKVEMKPGDLTKISFLVYMMPLILMTVGSLLGFNYSENLSIIFGTMGLMCGLIILIIINKKVSNKKFITLTKIE